MHPILFVVCLCLSSCALAQRPSSLELDADWHQVNTTGTMPVNVSHCSSAKHGAIIYVFCGWRADHRSLQVERFNDLYTLNTSSRHWTKLNQSGDVPPPRGSAVMTMIEIGSLPFLFLYGGGEITRLLPGPGFSFQFYDDLHRFNISSGTWTRLFPSGSRPSGKIRVAHELTDFLLKKEGFSSEETDSLPTSRSLGVSTIPFRPSTTTGDTTWIQTLGAKSSRTSSHLLTLP
jgi:galactose oxidase-like protein